MSLLQCCGFFFNDSIVKGEILSAWKCANVVPIFKGSGKPKDSIVTGQSH